MAAKKEWYHRKRLQQQFPFPCEIYRHVVRIVKCNHQILPTSRHFTTYLPLVCYKYKDIHICHYHYQYHLHHHANTLWPHFPQPRAKGKEKGKPVRYVRYVFIGFDRTWDKENNLPLSFKVVCGVHHTSSHSTGKLETVWSVQGIDYIFSVFVKRFSIFPFGSLVIPVVNVFQSGEYI